LGGLTTFLAVGDQRKGSLFSAVQTVAHGPSRHLVRCSNMSVFGG
jgi:hypothetical protein